MITNIEQTQIVTWNDVKETINSMIDYGHSFTVGSADAFTVCKTQEYIEHVREDLIQDMARGDFRYLFVAAIKESHSQKQWQKIHEQIAKETEVILFSVNSAKDEAKVFCQSKKQLFTGLEFEEPNFEMETEDEIF